MWMMPIKIIHPRLGIILVIRTERNRTTETCAFSSLLSPKSLHSASSACLNFATFREASSSNLRPPCACIHVCSASRHTHTMVLPDSSHDANSNDDGNHHVSASDVLWRCVVRPQQSSSSSENVQAWANACSDANTLECKLAPTEEGTRRPLSDAINVATVPVATLLGNAASPEALLAVFGTTLARWCAQDKVVVGVLTPDDDDVATSVFVADVVAWERTGVALADVARAAHEDGACAPSTSSTSSSSSWTWTDVATKAGMEPDPFRHPLFQAAFALHAEAPSRGLRGDDTDDEGGESEAAARPYVPRALAGGHLDVRLDVWKAASGAGFEGQLAYRLDVWRQETAMLYAAALRRAWEGYCAVAGATSPEALPLITDEQAQRLIVRGTPGIATPRRADVSRGRRCRSIHTRPGRKDGSMMRPYTLSEQGTSRTPRSSRRLLTWPRSSV